MQRGPIIDGLPAWYTRDQLRKFRDGIRGQNPANISEQLMGSTRDHYQDDATIELLAQYIASLPVQPYLRVVRGDESRGEERYRSSCLSCHGNAGQGNEILKSPPLNIQEDWYLLDQLRKYASGKRGSHPRDLTGMQMAGAVASIDDQGLKDLVAFMQRFGAVPEAESSR